ncbi:SpaH/EbpB family LPXTG-anchored major pilin [uncultured Bifidobacterium sp.]|uniref:SpaH/EbpB family LPXTG-anchored major pilin n=1 Tax=uncultured Bifidobacterium sp. TaxID=165187 RepID=UPI002621D996|nr:SpaH/EbpB family LPXTG-anchored major pilin [uncultured Bifidobacterium sp.]
MREHVRRSAGMAAAAVVAACLLAGGLTATTATADTSTAHYGNIDESQSGSIIIHKGEQQGDSDSGTASGTAPKNFKGLVGVVFAAYPITSVDLATNSGWTTVNGWTSSPVASIADGTACDGVSYSGTTLTGTPTLTGQTLGDPIVSSATDSDGKATIDTGTGAKAYLVCEVSTTNTASSTVVDKAEPFIVTVPYPDTEGSDATNGWLYDVNVYPKNGVASISKTVTVQSSLGLGSTASFPTTVTVPAIADARQFSGFWVQDPMDSRLTDDDVSSVTVDGKALDSGYYVTSVDKTSNLVTMQFTQDGLSWLKNNAGKKVVVTFSGTVNSLGDGAIKNTAYFGSTTETAAEPPTTPMEPPTDPTNPGTTPSTPSNSVTQNWGDLVLKKIDSGDSSSALSGAKFQVFESKDPYAADCTTGDAATAANGTAIPVSGSDTFTSDSDGKADIAGLFVSDSQNDPGKGSDYRCYVVKETKAPIGYVLDSTYHGVAVKTGVTDGMDLTLTNTKEAIPGLPLTGSQATMALLAVGVLLIGGAGLMGAARRRLRRRRLAPKRSLSSSRPAACARERPAEAVTWTPTGCSNVPGPIADLGRDGGLETIGTVRTGACGPSGRAVVASGRGSSRLPPFARLFFRRLFFKVGERGDAHDDVDGDSGRTGRYRRGFGAYRAGRIRT